MTREKMIDFALSKVGRVAYAMAYPARLGPYFYDCSSFVYYALIAGGFLAKGSAIGNTESLYRLKGKVLREIYSYDEVERGDIFIRGIEGRSAGPYGHTGIFLAKDKIIHCSYGANGVVIADRSTGIGRVLDRKRSVRERYFRPIGLKNQTGVRFIDKIGMAIIKVVTNVRTEPSTKAGIVAAYPAGSVVYYDRLAENEGYLWASYIGRSSGKRRYVAIEKKG
ncbi:peptidoglycan amidohydrolase family protein [uncultured Anaerococcus sp.]|uniref:peptidoglycan amidohydrolase family protein n=1 Tax=uncultured Anaerococcus sp. TaxID=293428 RepID=UPI00288900D3|nr:peptidoglycan amidohydrolase family protein [uncultured Anaerococcus sp.]